MKKISSTIIFLFFLLFSKASMSYADKIENRECLKYFAESSFSEATTSCLKRVNELKKNEVSDEYFGMSYMASVAALRSANYSIFEQLIQDQLFFFDEYINEFILDMESGNIEYDPSQIFLLIQTYVAYLVNHQIDIELAYNLHMKYHPYLKKIPEDL